MNNKRRLNMFYSKNYTKIGDMLLMPIIYDCVAIYNCILDSFDPKFLYKEIFTIRKTIK